MLYNIYAIQDVMIGFNAPFIMKNDEIAKREYGNFLKKTDNAKDMRLFKIGVFNDENGTIESITPQIIEGGGN